MLVGVAFVEAFDCEAGFKMDLEMLVGVVFAEALDCEARFPAFDKSGMILSVEVTLGPTGQKFDSEPLFVKGNEKFLDPTIFKASDCELLTGEIGGASHTCTQFYVNRNVKWFIIFQLSIKVPWGMEIFFK